MVPTSIPTPSDIGSLSVTMVMSASSAPTSQDKKSLKAAISNQSGVAESSIRNFQVSYVESVRRRNLLAGGIWNVYFDVMVSLSQTSYTNVNSFKFFFEASLNEPSFETNVKSAITSVESVNSVVSIIVTRRPTSTPTSRPTIEDDDHQKTDRFSVDIGSANFIILMVVGSIGVVTILAGCMHDYLSKYNGVHPQKRFSGSTISSLTDCEYLDDDNKTLGFGNSGDKYDDDDIFKGLELGNLERVDSIRFLASLRARGYIDENNESCSPVKSTTNSHLTSPNKMNNYFSSSSTSSAIPNKVINEPLEPPPELTYLPSAPKGAMNNFAITKPSIPFPQQSNSPYNYYVPKAGENIAEPTCPPPQFGYYVPKPAPMLEPRTPPPAVSFGERIAVQRSSTSSSDTSSTPSGPNPQFFSRFPPNRTHTTPFPPVSVKSLLPGLNRGIDTITEHAETTTDSRLKSLDTFEDVILHVGKGTNMDDMEVVGFDSSVGTGSSTSQSSFYSVDDSIAMKARKKKRRHMRPKTGRRNDSGRGIGTSLDGGAGLVQVKNPPRVIDV
jgi:hypothetical protein